MERQTVRIEIARPEGEESHMHIKVEKILNGYLVRALLPGFPEYDEPLFLPTASLVQTHSRAVMDAWVKGEQSDTEGSGMSRYDELTRAASEKAAFAERCARAKRIIARARDDLGADLGGGFVSEVLANNMAGISPLEVMAVMAAIGEE